MSGTKVTVKICIIRFKETYIIFSPKQQFFKLVNSGLKYQFSGFLSSLFLSKASACTPAGALPLDPAGGCAPRPLPQLVHLTRTPPKVQGRLRLPCMKILVTGLLGSPGNLFSFKKIFFRDKKILGGNGLPLSGGRQQATLRHW